MRRRPYVVHEVHAGKSGFRWGRFVMWGAVVLAILIAGLVGGSYLWFNHMVGGANSKVSDDVRQALDRQIQSTGMAESPDSMDILVLGSDNRDTTSGGRSDTLMLVHIDPSQDYLSILSIPRDLRVNIPGHGMDKINAAYAYGGPALSITTVEELTGVKVDHYVEIDFQAFRDLTDSIGGVYLDVDHTYLNQDPTWELIRLAPGYQLLDGGQALSYVRFRHDQNGDFGRMERQQRYLTALKSQLTSSSFSLAFKLPGLASALLKNVGTDLSTNQILRLAYWGLRLQGTDIRQIRITGDTPTIEGVSYVVADQKSIAAAVRQLITPPDRGPAAASSASGDSSTSQGPSRYAATGSDGASSTAPASTIKATAATMPDGEQWAMLSRHIGFSVEGPGYIPDGCSWKATRPGSGGTYDIEVGKGMKPAVKMIYRYKQQDEYLGIMETTWLDAPAAAEGQQVKYQGTVFTVVGTDQKVDRIWWKRNGALYWVSNTISYLISKQDLLKMAESFIVIPKN